LAYIGNTPAEKYSAFQKQDFTTSATTSYTLDNPVANANELALFINFVRQEPTSSYSASGTSLTLTEATSSSDDMYCVYLGKAVQTVTPASGSVTNAMLGETITVAKGGTGLTSGFANGITMADQWRLTTTTNSGTDADVTSNWERNDTSGYSSIGTGLTESSGIFSFPQTGIYYIIFNARLQLGASDTSANFDLEITTDNSSYDIVAQTGQGNGSTSATVNSSINFFLFDVTNVTTHKFKFATTSFASGTFLSGSTDRQRTGFTVIRIGDT